MIRMPATAIAANPSGRFTDEELEALILSGGGPGASSAPSPSPAPREPIGAVSPADVGQASPGAQNAYGALEPGNMDLSMRPHVKNPDGSISTVRSLGFQDDDGKEVLIPTVNDRGFVMSDDDAIAEYRRTGRHLGKFGSVEASNAAAEAIHRDQESKMPRKLTVADDDLLNPDSGPALATAAASEASKPADPVDALMARESAKMDEEATAEQQRTQLHDYYANRAKQTPGDEPGDYEKIYRKTHSRPEGWRRILAGIGGALAGRSDGGHAVGAGMEEYDAGLAAAMGKDLEHRRGSDYIDEATAHLLMKYYGLSPEQAANVRKGSDALGLMNNLGSIDMRKAEMEERNKDRDADRERREQEFQERMEFMRMNSARTDETRRLGIEARKKSGGGGGGGGGAGKALLADAIDSYVVKQSATIGGPSLSLAQAKALREGDTAALAGVNPALLERARGALIDARAAAKYDPKAFTKSNVTVGSREATEADAPGKAAAIKSNDPEKKKDARQWINENGRAIDDALKKWNAMSNFGRTTLVKFPGKVEGIDWDKYIRDGTAKEEDKDAARAISALQNIITKERSGASVSVNEMTRLYNEFGQGILKNPRQMGQWLGRMKQTYDDQANNLEMTYDNLWED